MDNGSMLDRDERVLGDDRTLGDQIADNGCGPDEGGN
jgi:hypothetical protein